MSIDLQQAIQEQVRVLSEAEMQRVFDFIQHLRKAKITMPAKPISAMFDDLSSEIPFEEWNELPSDGAENHDHYLYGAPKKTRSL